MSQTYLKLNASTWKRDQFNLYDYECKSHDQSDFKIKSSTFLIRSGDKCTTNEFCLDLSEARNQLLHIQKLEHGFTIEHLNGSNVGLWTVVKFLGSYELKEDDIIKFGRENLIVKKICGKVSANNVFVEASPVTGEKCCKICCSEENDNANPLISLCKCDGSMKFTHYNCLKIWLKNKVTCNSIGRVATYMWNQFKCEVCKEVLPDFFYFNGEIMPMVEIEYPDSPYLLLEDVKEGRQTLYVIGMQENEKVQIGRDSTCEIRLNDISVSRVHSIITYKNNKFYIQDNKSKFGTLVNLCKEINLEQGQSADVQVGRTLIRMKVIKPWKCCFKAKVLPG